MRVADAEPAGAGERRDAIGVVLDRAHRLDERFALHALRQIGVNRVEAPGEHLVRVLAELVKCFGRNDDADAHGLRRKRNEPGPVVGLGIEDERVVSHLAWIADGAFDLREDRDLIAEQIELPGPRDAGARQEAGRAARVDQHLAAQRLGRAGLCIVEGDSLDSLVALDHLQRLSVNHARAGLRRLLEQHFVEVVAPDLPGLGQHRHEVLVARATDHLHTGLDGKAKARHHVAEAEVADDVAGDARERLADVIPGELLLLEDRHRESGPARINRCGRAARPTADHAHVAMDGSNCLASSRSSGQLVSTQIRFDQRHQLVRPLARKRVARSSKPFHHREFDALGCALHGVGRHQPVVQTAHEQGRHDDAFVHRARELERIAIEEGGERGAGQSRGERCKRLGARLLLNIEVRRERSRRRRSRARAASPSAARGLRRLRRRSRPARGLDADGGGRTRRRSARWHRGRSARRDRCRA